MSGLGPPRGYRGSNAWGAASRRPDTAADAVEPNRSARERMMGDDNHSQIEGAMTPADVPDEWLQKARDTVHEHLMTHHDYETETDKWRAIIAAVLSLHAQQLREQLAAETAITKELLQRNVELGTRADNAEAACDDLRAQLAAANERAEYLDAEALRLRHDTDEARRERDQWREDWRQLRARLDGLGEEWGYRFGQGGGEDGFDSETTARLIAAPEDTIVRRLATDWEVVGEPVAQAPDAAADGHSATQTSAQ